MIQNKRVYSLMCCTPSIYLYWELVLFYVVNKCFQTFRHPFVFMIYKLFPNLNIHITHVKITQISGFNHILRYKIRKKRNHISLGKQSGYHISSTNFKNRWNFQWLFCKFFIKNSSVITFKSSAIFDDFNDIVTEAIREGFIGESCRKNVWIARGVIEYEYEYIGMGRKIKSGKRYKEI